ncbi:MAG: efflux RND transporter periplasmic adaptor subunit [Chloroflexi bacterium]|nr:efflux RND transporter periplasmic adaptor subunit [Chloroflexota bacterium]
MRTRTLVGALLGLGLMLAVAACTDTQAVPVKPTPTAAAQVGGRPVGDRVIVEGRVVPVRRADLALSTTGVVAEVLVAEGDKVSAGQALLRLESKRQQAAVAQADAALARVIGARAGANAVLSKAQAALALLKAGPRAEDIAVARQGVAVARAELARVQSTSDPIALARAKADVEKAARAVQQAQFAYDRVKDAPFGNIGPEALRLEQTTIDYNLAQTVFAQLSQGPRATDLQAAQERATQAQTVQAQAEAGPRTEQIAAADADVAAASAALKNLDTDAAAAQAALDQAKFALADTELRAPFAGSVVTLNVKAGEAVPVGGFAVRLADLSAWQIETSDLTELNIASVREGAPVALTFDALPGAALSGKVGRIRAYGETRQGDIVYTAIIALDKPDARMRWNMTAKAAIEPQP